MRGIGPGKGDKRVPQQVSDEDMTDNWDKAYETENGEAKKIEEKKGWVKTSHGWKKLESSFKKENQDDKQDISECSGKCANCQCGSSD